MSEQSDFQPIGRIARDAALRQHPAQPGENDLREDIRNSIRINTEKDFLQRLSAYLQQGVLKAVNPISRAPFDPALPQLEPSDPMWALGPAEQRKALELLGQRTHVEEPAPGAALSLLADQADEPQLPSFAIPVRPLAVPNALRGLSPNRRVRYEHGASCGITGSGITSVGNLVDEFERAIARQRKGAFHPDEAAHLVAEAQGFDSKSFRKRLEDAYRAGTLIVRAPDTELPRKPSESWRPHSDIVTVDDLNSWLRAQGVSYRFPGMELLANHPLSLAEKDLLVSVSDDGVLGRLEPGTASSAVQSLQETQMASLDGETSAAPMQPLVHRLATRRDVLAPVVDDLLRNAADKSDYAALWNAFVHLADLPNPPPPLMQYVEGEVKYRGTDGATVIGRDAFIKRLKRRASSRR